LRIDVEHPVEMPGKVDHGTSAKCIASDGSSATSGGYGDLRFSERSKKFGDVVIGFRERNYLRNYAVDRGISGVFGAPPGSVLDLASDSWR
jgi:hypothetical protein